MPFPPFAHTFIPPARLFLTCFLLRSQVLGSCAQSIAETRQNLALLSEFLSTLHSSTGIAGPTAPLDLSRMQPAAHSIIHGFPPFASAHRHPRHADQGVPIFGAFGACRMTTWAFRLAFSPDPTDPGTTLLVRSNRPPTREPPLASSPVPLSFAPDMRRSVAGHDAARSVQHMVASQVPSSLHTRAWYLR